MWITNWKLMKLLCLKRSIGNLGYFEVACNNQISHTKVKVLLSFADESKAHRHPHCRDKKWNLHIKRRRIVFSHNVEHSMLWLFLSIAIYVSIFYWPHMYKGTSRACTTCAVKSIESSSDKVGEGKFYQCHEQFLRLWDYVYGWRIFWREFNTICQDQKFFFSFCPFLLCWLLIQVTESLNVNYLSSESFHLSPFWTFHIRFQNKLISRSCKMHSNISFRASLSEKFFHFSWSRRKLH